MSLPDSVGVHGPAARAHGSPNRGALSATSEPADTRAGESRSGYRQLVTMLLPETTFVAVMTMSGDSRSVCRLRRCNRLACESQS
jgi:hypothetical protein